MENALQDFYYQFHTNQHYFLCHDILEEAWKENPQFSKDDAIVSLILLATGCYHYRRHNHVGALRSFKKALNVIEKSEQSIDLGIYTDEYKKIIIELIQSVGNANQFVPIQLPITKEMEYDIFKKYPDFVRTPHMIEDSYIVNHHLERDRSEVDKARQQALDIRRAKK
ncbi:DUF309 domain-containing protein [Staphylococcus equorum]|uniref:DUF309 domain-containing protein n=1 Tax=Staphylococcus equorum TaxID=246432 RepID=A0A9X4R028_9STAP|nr:DUF309 domain-containing protein [Staphylococcus equorum]MDG0842496.1 DUF309 domain-containing protein [Staphylococcus equorum]MDG0858372.1 DUF309 domain-containing protein [Staphylococcus equorum]